MSDAAIAASKSLGRTVRRYGPVYGYFEVAVIAIISFVSGTAKLGVPGFIGMVLAGAFLIWLYRKVYVSYLSYLFVEIVKDAAKRGGDQVDPNGTPDP